MSTPYRPITWGDEYISSDKLNVMASNDQYLFEQTPRVYYNAYGIRKSTGGLKIMVGVKAFTPNKKVSSVSKDIYFGNFFSQGCKPVITTGLAMGPGGRYHVVLSGVGASTINPDHRGANIRIIANALSSKDSRINTKLVVHWMAVGW